MTCQWPHKQRHASREAANKAIAELYRAGKGNPDLHAYRCHAEPEHWHVGHDPVHFSRRIKSALRQSGKPNRGRANRR